MVVMCVPFKYMANTYIVVISLSLPSNAMHVSSAKNNYARFSAESIDTGFIIYKNQLSCSRAKNEFGIYHLFCPPFTTKNGRTPHPTYQKRSQTYHFWSLPKMVAYLPIMVGFS